MWVNGRRVGAHVGGFAPWSVEITHAVDATTTVGTPGGTHEVVVRVIDSTDGAQVLHLGSSEIFGQKRGGVGLVVFLIDAFFTTLLNDI